MLAYKHVAPRQIIFGSGSRFQLPGLLQQFGKTVLIITGKSFLIRDSLGPLLFDALKKNGLTSYHAIINREPEPHDIDSICRQYRNSKIEVVLAIGGGSVLDGGKAVSAMLRLEEPVVEYLESVGTKVHPGIKVPFIAMPTTSGTGSEATMNAVITQTGDKAFKKSLRHINLVPDIALIDPEFTQNCPPKITAATGMDAFTQLVESYLSVKATPLTDALALDGIRAIVNSLETAFKDGKNLHAREDVAYAALLSGICLANTGLGVVHGFAQPLGSSFKIPHGMVCGTLMAAANKITVKKINKESSSHVWKKYEELAGIVLFNGEKKRTDPKQFIDYLEMLTNKLQLPKLSSFGIGIQHFDKIIKDTELKNHPVKLEQQDLISILKERI